MITITKSRMLMLMNALQFAIDSEEFEATDEELEILRRLYDIASKCHHGDGNSLDVMVNYGYTIR
jgi:hypothetical protein